MKTVLTSIITSVVTVIIALVVVWAIVDDDKCIFSDDDHEKVCKENVKKECHPKKDAYHMNLSYLLPAREKLETKLSDEEKASIEAIREKFEDVDHDKMCEEGKKKFQEQHKEDLNALLAIAKTHKDFLDEVHAKMHMTAAGHETEVKKDGCPEAAKCKEATTKCMGEQKDAEAEMKCKEAMEECKVECRNNFDIHFLLMDDDCEDDDDDGDEEEDDD